QNSSTSAAQYQYGKITICHHTHSKKHPFHTITISQNAWKAHQKHGDTLGPCPATPPKAKENGKGKDEGKGNGNGKDDGGDKSGTTPGTGTTAPTTGTGSTGDQA